MGLNMSTVGINASKRFAVLFFVGLLSAVSVSDVGPNWIEQWGSAGHSINLFRKRTAGPTVMAGFVNGDSRVIGPVNLVEINPPHA
jgi:hypothetical protein